LKALVEFSLDKIMKLVNEVTPQPVRRPKRMGTVVVQPEKLRFTFATHRARTLGDVDVLGETGSSSNPSK
jgi:hypothetical protein